MSNFREIQSALTRTWASGSDGLKNAISASIPNYAGDKAFKPFDMGQMNRKQSVANYGAWLQVHKNLSADWSVALADTIFSRQDDLDKVLDKPTAELKALVESWDSARLDAIRAEAQKNLALGKTFEAKAEQFAELAEHIVMLSKVTTTKAGIYELLKALEALKPLTSGAEVAA